MTARRRTNSWQRPLLRPWGSTDRFAVANPDGPLALRREVRSPDGVDVETPNSVRLPRFFEATRDGATRFRARTVPALLVGAETIVRGPQRLQS